MKKDVKFSTSNLLSGKKERDLASNYRSFAFLWSEWKYSPDIESGKIFVTTANNTKLLIGIVSKKRQRSLDLADR